MKYILSKSQLGDWFVLYQLSKNSTSYFYREFVKELAIELKKRPKKSKSKNVSKFESVPTTPSAPKKSIQEKRNILIGDENENEIHV